MFEKKTSRGLEWHRVGRCRVISNDIIKQRFVQLAPYCFFMSSRWGNKSRCVSQVYETSTQHLHIVDMSRQERSSSCFIAIVPVCLCWSYDWNFVLVLWLKFSQGTTSYVRISFLTRLIWLICWALRFIMFANVSYSVIWRDLISISHDMGKYNDLRFVSRIRLAYFLSSSSSSSSFPSTRFVESSHPRVHHPHPQTYPHLCLPISVPTRSACSVSRRPFLNLLHVLLVQDSILLYCFLNDLVTVLYIIKPLIRGELIQQFSNFSWYSANTLYCFIVPESRLFSFPSSSSSKGFKFRKIQGWRSKFTALLALHTSLRVSWNVVAQYMSGYFQRVVVFPVSLQLSLFFSDLELDFRVWWFRKLHSWFDVDM